MVDCHEQFLGPVSRVVRGGFERAALWLGAVSVDGASRIERDGPLVSGLAASLGHDLARCLTVVPVTVAATISGSSPGVDEIAEDFSALMMGPAPKVLCEDRRH